MGGEVKLGGVGVWEVYNRDAPFNVMQSPTTHDCGTKTSLTESQQKWSL